MPDEKCKKKAKKQKNKTKQNENVSMIRVLSLSRNSVKDLSDMMSYILVSSVRTKNTVVLKSAFGITIFSKGFVKNNNSLRTYLSCQ